MARKMTRGRTPRGGKSREMLVVASKVKAFVRSKNMNTSADALSMLSERVYGLIEGATSRAGANGRKTIKPQDI